MEYICSQFPSDLEIQLSQAKFAQKNGFDSDQCSRALSDTDIRVSGSLESSLQGFARFSSIAPGEKNTQIELLNIKLKLLNCRLRNLMPEFPPNICRGLSFNPNSRTKFNFLLISENSSSSRTL